MLLSKFLKIDELIDALTEYVKVKLELIKLGMIEEISEIIAQVIALFLMLSVFLFFLAFGSISVAAYLNELLHSGYLGYTIMTGFYLLVLFVFLYLLRSGKLKEAVEEQIARAVKEREEMIKKSVQENEQK